MKSHGFPDAAGDTAQLHVALLEEDDDLDPDGAPTVSITGTRAGLRQLIETLAELCDDAEPGMHTHINVGDGLVVEDADANLVVHLVGEDWFSEQEGDAWLPEPDGAYIRIRLGATGLHRNH